MRAGDSFYGLGKGRFKTETLVQVWNVVVNGFGNSDDTLAETSTSDLLNECGAAFESAIPTDNEQDVDIEMLKAVDHFSGVLRTTRSSQHRTTEGLNHGDYFRPELKRLPTVPLDQTLVPVADPENFLYTVFVPKLHDDPADHVVHAGGQTAAGDNRRSRVCRIKIEVFSRSSDFKSQGGLLSSVVDVLAVQAVITHDLIRIELKSCSMTVHVRQG